MPDYNQSVIEEFRANHGKVGGMQAANDLLLLTAKGAKSGQMRTVPLAYSQDGDDYVIVASKGGAPTHPAWYFNVLANPEVTVEVGDEKFQARAIEAQGDERERLFDQHAKKMPGFNDYKQNTSRVLPVFVLKRTD